MLPSLEAQSGVTKSKTMGRWGSKECVWEVWVRRKGWGSLLPQGPGEIGVKRKNQECLWTGSSLFQGGQEAQVSAWAPQPIHLLLSVSVALAPGHPLCFQFLVSPHNSLPF